MLFGLPCPVCAQVEALVLSSGTTSAGGSVNLALTLTSPGTGPAAIQFRLGYTPASITSISAVAGSSAVAAGKSLTCAASQAGAYNCVLAGMNTNLMSNGAV